VRLHDGRVLSDVLNPPRLQEVASV
jgi:hypothetical protein